MDFPSLDTAIDHLTYQIQSLSWDDLPSKLETNEKQARKASSLVFIGRLLAKKALNKPSLLETICKVWDFAYFRC